MLKYVAAFMATGVSTSVGQVSKATVERELFLDGFISEDVFQDGGTDEVIGVEADDALSLSMDLGGYVTCGEVRELNLLTDQASDLTGDTLTAIASSGVGFSHCGELPFGYYTIRNDYRIDFEVSSAAAYTLEAELLRPILGPAFAFTDLYLVRDPDGLSDILLFATSDEPELDHPSVSGILEPGAYALIVDHITESQTFEELPRPTTVAYTVADVWSFLLTIDGLGDALGGACGSADLAAPFGDLDIADVVEFLRAFGAGESDADLAAPFGMFDIADVVEFLRVFGAGCP